MSCDSFCWAFLLFRRRSAMDHHLQNTCPGSCACRRSHNCPVRRCAMPKHVPQSQGASGPVTSCGGTTHSKCQASSSEPQQERPQQGGAFQGASGYGSLMVSPHPRQAAGRTLRRPEGGDLPSKVLATGGLSQQDKVKRQAASRRLAGPASDDQAAIRSPGRRTSC